MSRANRRIEGLASFPNFRSPTHFPNFAVLAALLVACSGPGTMDGSVEGGGRDVAFDAPTHDVPRCSSNADCVGDPGGAACEVTSGRCVECVSSNDVCPPAQHCDDAQHQCVSGCHSDLGCMLRDGGALPDGGTFAIGRCDTSTHACVECLGAGDCPGGMVCTSRVCTVGCSATEPCASGSDCCGGGCVDVTSNIDNCGACGSRCAPAHASGVCAGGHCGIAACNAGFGDCDGDAANGCETDLSSTTDHCGSCATMCASGANGAGTCVMGACSLACATGFGDCDANAANGCEATLTSDTANCGACGMACVAPAGATATCAGSTCGFTCDTGMADCDTNAANGCEVALAIAPANCGACGNACPAAPNATATCGGGTCGTVCNAAFGNCDGMAANGCETSLSNNATNCGACGTTCSAPSNAAALCISGSCAFACLPGFMDCDSSGTNGCETDTRTNPMSCGTCGTVCPATPNATPTCSSGLCGFTCSTGFGNCDGNAANGCEADLTANNANCGACGTTCGAGTVCVGGTCRSSWAERFGGAGVEVVEGVATDASGNLYVTGFFDSSVDFGGGPLASAGGPDVFVASFTASGAHRWSRRFGGASNDVANRIAVDRVGNVYLIGNYSGSVDFGTGPLGSAGGSDVFVVSLDPSGTTRWARRYGGTGNDQGNGIAADIAGGVAVAIAFTGSIDFGTGALASSGLSDVALASLDANGIVRWAQRYGSTGSEQPFAIAEDATGDLYVAGFFTGASDLGGGPASSTGGSDIFVARYESTVGAHVWSRRFGSAGNDQGLDVTVDGSGNVYVVGIDSGSIDFGTGALAFAGGQDGFLLALAPAGTTRWIDRIAGTGSDTAYRTVVTTSGDIAVAGYFTGTTDLGAGPVMTSGTAAFAAAYASTSGAVRWTRTFGSGGDVEFYAMAAESHGGLILGGQFTTSQNLFGTTLMSAGSIDSLLVTLYP